MDWSPFIGWLVRHSSHVTELRLEDFDDRAEHTCVYVGSRTVRQSATCQHARESARLARYRECILMSATGWPFRGSRCGRSALIFGARSRRSSSGTVHASCQQWW